ncbi:hypothetical protein K402DRAFT_392902 [Aulographum hederae CBS 113979]|uniref:Uncharacterized protein n=1 Tax=Aulographum hederae CBS 113979 TaxID=1176131 RepID=A0A6G1H1W7_9PEZI|nr:hypothetical protein K402DRAFT_392902 [Aulographum hederae CBS 113979]
MYIGTLSLLPALKIHDQVRLRRGSAIRPGGLQNPRNHQDKDGSQSTRAAGTHMIAKLALSIPEVPPSRGHLAHGIVFREKAHHQQNMAFCPWLRRRGEVPLPLVLGRRPRDGSWISLPRFLCVENVILWRLWGKPHGDSVSICGGDTCSQFP